MRLQWKYALIINLSVLAILVTFFLIDDKKARSDLEALHERFKSERFRDVERGAILRAIAEKVRLRVEDEVVRWQGFYPQKIENALQALKQDESEMRRVVDINVTLGLNAKIQASLVPGKSKADHINFTQADLLEVEKNQVQVYDLVSLGHDRYATEMIIRYEAGPIDTQMDWYLFGIGLTFREDLDNQRISNELRSAFKAHGRLFPLPSSSQRDLENGDVSEGLRQTFEYYGISLAQTATVSMHLDRWLITDPEHNEIYAVKREEDQLNVYNNRLLLSQETSVSIQEKGHKWLITDSANKQRYFVSQGDNELNVYAGWAPAAEQITGLIQVLFEAPDVTKHIYESRLRHLIYVIVVIILLVIIIDMTTTRLIMRPLESMMEIIKHAEAGDLESLPQSYSSGEIGRVTYSLVRMLTQLREAHSKRISALGQFAGGVAHEIRNPLNTIGMTAQHLKQLFGRGKEVKAEDIEEARELLEIVVDEIEHLKRISEQFLTLNRPKKLKLVPTDLNALLDGVLAEFTLQMEKAKVQVIRDYDTDCPHIQLDSGLIRQAIFNLIQNSIQAMPKGGRIYITTKLARMAIGEGIVLEIRDTGVGIPEEIQERIFDAYFTTKENEGGMGLGLAISHQIITAHQGQIDLKSQVGMGTAFKIRLPITEK